MSYSSDSLMRARVCEAAQEHYTVRFEDGAECYAAAAGVLRWNAECRLWVTGTAPAQPIPL
jgi:hypothetical protein